MASVQETLTSIIQLETLLQKEMEEFEKVQKHFQEMGVENIEEAEKEILATIEENIALQKKVNEMLTAKLKEYGS